MSLQVFMGIRQILEPKTSTSLENKNIASFKKRRLRKHLCHSIMTNDIFEISHLKDQWIKNRLKQ